MILPVTEIIFVVNFAVVRHYSELASIFYYLFLNKSMKYAQKLNTIKT